jgi:2'-5' RNA ligase
MLRSFVAISIGPELRHQLDVAQRQLRGAKASVKWVPAKNLHLTLKFLGNIAEESVPEVMGALGSAARGVRPFAMRVRGLGAFPDLRRPRVVWAGIAEGAQQATHLAQAVERELGPLGFAPEKRPFSAHITLGRVSSFVGVSALAGIVEQHAESEFGSVEVDEILLMRSELRPTGAVYSVLGELPLGS